MTKLVALALVLAGCGGGSSGSTPGDDEPTPDAPKDPSTRTWTFAPLGNGKNPKYAVSPSGTLAVATSDDLGVQKFYFSDGSTLGSPHGPQANHEGAYGIAYDKDSSLHVFFGLWGGTNIEHWVYRAQAWHELPALTPRTELVVANGPHGEMYGLASEVTGTLAKLSLLTLGADGTVTKETLDTIKESDVLTFAVGRDGNPALAWAPAEASGYPQYMQRGASGWRKTQLGAELVRLPRIAIAAGDLATVFIDTRYLSQQTFTTWSSPVPAADLGPYIATTTDAYGIVHACTADKYGQLAQGTLTVKKLDDGGADCWLATDAAGRLHMAFHLGEVIKRAVFD